MDSATWTEILDDTLYPWYPPATSSVVIHDIEISLLREYRKPRPEGRQSKAAFHGRICGARLRGIERHDQSTLPQWYLGETYKHAAGSPLAIDEGFTRGNKYSGNKKLVQSLSAIALREGLALVDYLLKQFEADPAHADILKSIYNQEESGLSTLPWKTNHESYFPIVIIVEDSVLGSAIGAYISSNQTILIRQGFLEDVAEQWLAGRKGAIYSLAKVLLEEYGHHLDYIFNGSQDTPGDEGRLFSAVVTGEQIPVNDFNLILAEGHLEKSETHLIRV